MADPAQLALLNPFCDGVSTAIEGGFTYLLLAALRLPPGISPAAVDALLRLGARGDGYPNRLYLSQRVVGAKISLNWNAADVRILERNWFAYSWKAPPELGIDGILLEHLKALR
jgi:hypothetical protein